MTIIRKKDGERTVERRVIRGARGNAMPTEAEIAAMIPEIDIKHIKGKCDAAEPVVSETRTDENGQRQKIFIRLCGDREMARDARASALDGLREARTEIAQDEEMPASIRAKVVANLEAQIAKMQAQAD